MDSVKFEGTGPFSLPVAQSATARAVGGTVEIVFRVLGNPSLLVDVAIPIVPNQALELLGHLDSATRQAADWVAKNQR